MILQMRGARASASVLQRKPSTELSAGAAEGLRKEEESTVKCAGVLRAAAYANMPGTSPAVHHDRLLSQLTIAR